MTARFAMIARFPWFPRFSRRSDLARRRIRSRLHCLPDGQSSFPVFVHRQYPNLDYVIVMEIILDVLNVGIRYLGDMNQSGLTVWQSNKGTEMRNPSDSTFYYLAYFNDIG